MRVKEKIAAVHKKAYWTSKDIAELTETTESNINRIITRLKDAQLITDNDHQDIKKKGDHSNKTYYRAQYTREIVFLILLTSRNKDYRLSTAHILATLSSKGYYTIDSILNGNEKLLQQAQDTVNQHVITFE